MNIFNEQAQLFMAASFCLLIGLACLYCALGLYGMVLDKALRWIGVHAALVSYIQHKDNRKRWWILLGTWFKRNIEDRE